MTKAVLISIKPKWCEFIASGKKTIEVRKTRPKLEPPFKCYIYATKRGRPLVYGSPVPTYIAENLVQTYGYSWEDADRIFGTWNGKVIGEFVCDAIDTYIDSSNLSDAKIFRTTALNAYDIKKYAEAAGKCYGWNILNLKIYDEPKELSEFRKPMLPTGLRYEDDIIKHPPQSWCYVEEAQHDD